MIGGCKLGTRDMYCKYSRPCHRETSTTNDWTAWRGQPFIFLSYTNYYLEGLLQLVLCHNLDPDMPWTDGSYDRAVPTAVTRICPRVPTSSTSDTFRYGSSRQLVSHLLHFMFLVIFKELTFHRFSSIYTSIKRFRPHCRHELLPSFIVLAFVRLADIKEPTNPWQSLDKQVVRNQQWTFKR